MGATDSQQAFDCTLLSIISYSGVFDEWNNARSHRDDLTLQEFIKRELNKGSHSSLCRLNAGEKYMTQDEWLAVLRAASQSKTLSGYRIADVTKNPYDGSDLIYLEKTKGGKTEGIFVCEGTVTAKGWFEDFMLLASGDTASQIYAAHWARSIAKSHKGHNVSYISTGHSKGGSQAVAIARAIDEVEHVYAFDSPGDDLNKAADRTRIDYIANGNDFISAVLKCLGRETLVRGHSDDPNHYSGWDSSHGPINLLNFSYDKNGVLVCTGLGEDVTSEGGAYYRKLLKLASYAAAMNPQKNVIALILGAVLWGAQGGLASLADKVKSFLGLFNTRLNASKQYGNTAGVSDQERGYFEHLDTINFAMAAQQAHDLATDAGFITERIIKTCMTVEANWSGNGAAEYSTLAKTVIMQAKDVSVEFVEFADAIDKALASYLEGDEQAAKAISQIKESVVG